MSTKKSEEVPKGPSSVFDKAFDDANVLLNAEDQLARTSTKSARLRIAKRIKSRNAGLAHATKLHQDINRLTSRYIQLHDGEVDNVADLIRYLTDNGVRIVPDKSQGSGITERAVRTHLKNTFGIVGKAGRKLTKA